MKHDLYPQQISHWQQGCDDAKAGRPARQLNEGLLAQQGYDNGFYWAQHGQARPVLQRVDGYWLDGPYNERPCPPLKNPYMEGIEAIEGIMNRLRTFHREFPAEFAPGQKDAYVSDLVKVRDALHAMMKEDEFGE